jgi:hypothetical protein
LPAGAFSAAALGGVDVGVGIDGLQDGKVACLAEFAEVFGEGGFLFGHGASFVGWGGFQAALNGVGGRLCILCFVYRIRLAGEFGSKFVPYICPKDSTVRCSNILYFLFWITI